MIGAAIRKILTDNPDFTAIAGTSVYPLRVPQSKTFPAVTYQIISNSPTYCKQGDVGLDRKRIQINIFAKHYDQQEALAGIIRTSLSGYSGLIMGSDILAIKYETETDLFENGAETYFKTQDFTITINN